MLLRARKQLVAAPSASKLACVDGPCITATPPALATLATLTSLKDHDREPSFCVVGCLGASGHAGNCIVKDGDGGLSRVPLSIKRKWVVCKMSCPEAEEVQPAHGDAPETPKRPKLASALAQLQMPIAA